LQYSALGSSLDASRVTRKYDHANAPLSGRANVGTRQSSDTAPAAWRVTARPTHFEVIPEATENGLLLHFFLFLGSHCYVFCALLVRAVVFPLCYSASPCC
jgi:hypothetical protein